MMALIRLAMVAAGAVAVTATTSAGAEDSQRVAILGVGPDVEATASRVVSHLTSPYAPDSEAFRGAFGTAGVHLLAAATKHRDKDAELVARARAAARSSHVDKAILIHVDRARKATVLHVWVVDAQGSGGASIDQDVRVAAGGGDGADSVWSTVEGEFPPRSAESATPAAPVAESPPAAPTAPAHDDDAAAKPVEAASPEAPSSPPPVERTRANALAILGAGLQGGSRHFSYVDRLTPTLRPYDLFVAPLFAIEGEIYPFATMSLPFLSGLGAVGQYARAFAIGSQDSAGNEVGTSWQVFDLGLRERISLGASFVLGVDLGYGDDDFAFDNPVTPTEQLPSAHYKVLRGGLDGRFSRGTLSVSASASYLDVLSTGEFGTLFPRTSVGGVEAGLGASDRVAASLEVTLDVVYTRFFYNLLPQPGDAYVAGGALDQMATVSLGLAYLF